jgi:hypothetical protein
MPARELANAPRPRGHPVAALPGSMVYARILAIGGHLGKSPHFYVARPPEPGGMPGWGGLWAGNATRKLTGFAVGRPKVAM